MKILTVDLPQEIETLRVVGVSDIHRGDVAFDNKAFKKFVGWLEENEDVRIILNGDIANVAIKSSKSDVYAATMTPQEEVDWAIDQFLPFKDRILGVTTGNHEARIYKDTGWDPSLSLAKALDAPYGREGLFFRLRFGKNKHSKPQVYTLYVTHGHGQAKSFFGKVSKFIIADVIMIGHVHKLNVEQDSIFVPDLRNGNVMEVERTFVSAGSFLKWGGYAESMGLVPGTQTMPLLLFSGNEKKVNVLV